MIENFLIGAGSKVVSNVINSWLANSAENTRLSHLREEKAIHAHVELAKVTANDWASKLTRGIIYMMLSGTFCYMGIYFMTQINVESVGMALVGTKRGLLSGLFNQPTHTTKEVNIFLMFFESWVNIIETCLSAFVIPSRKR